MRADRESLITVCVTAYRRPTYLVQALLSCLTQDYRPLEILVSDDSPTDESEEAIRPLPVPEGVTLVYKRNAPSLGEAANVNSLYASAQGSRVLLLHDDDMLAPGAITLLAEVFSLDARVAASFGLQQVMSAAGEVQPASSEQLNRAYCRVPEEAGLVHDPLLSALRRQFPNNGYLVRTDLARRVGYRSPSEIGRAGDTDFAIRLAQQCQDSCFAFVAQPTTRCRVTPGSSVTMTGVAWKLYESLDGLPLLTAPQRAARDELKRQLAGRALTDYALVRQRRRALRVWRSRAYRKRVGLLRTFGHALLIFAPGLKRWGVRLRPRE